MIFLLSGEGASDIGQYDHQHRFSPGPMTYLIDQLVRQYRGGYSFLEHEDVIFMHKTALTEQSKSLACKHRPRLPGRARKVKKETAYFFRNAWALGLVAKRISDERDQPVIAILFRDADGTVSSGRGNYADKRASMERGFAQVEHDRSKGVPMIPQPKSEAWLLCAIKNPPYQHCNQLETASGNDSSPHSLKKQLAQQLGCPADSAVMIEKIQQGNIDPMKIHMPSMQDFKLSLESCLNSTLFLGDNHATMVS
jgi:hypothetical protein